MRGVYTRFHLESCFTDTSSAYCFPIIACTAVVTEISYHDKETINADVSFLSEAEWRSELKILVEDLVDEDGKVKSVKSLNNEAGVAWSKVHAVYPSILVRRLSFRFSAYPRPKTLLTRPHWILSPFLRAARVGLWVTLSIDHS